MAILLFLLVLFFAFLLHQCWYRRLHLPKGPFPLPIIGNAHSFVRSERWENKFMEWTQNYGKIYTYYMGPLPIIAINDYDLMVDMFVKDGGTYEDRATFEPLDIAARGGLYGLISVSGDLWREQRRYFLRVMREFGLGKNQMQERVLEEVRTICERLNSDIQERGEDDEHDVQKYTDIATGSLINAIICGYRFTSNGREEEFYKMKQITDDLMKVLVDPLLHMGVHSSYLTKIPPFRSRVQKACALFDEIFNFLGSVIDDHLADHDYTHGPFEPTDFIDAYLMEMQKNKTEGKESFFGYKHKDSIIQIRRQLQNIAFDVYVAGQETTAATVTWTIAYLLCHLDVQEKMQEELSREIGSDRLVKMSDRLQLPYTNAVIFEAIRCSNIIAQNVPRRTTRDVEIGGCLVPKGTAILAQVSVLAIDPKIYPNPQEFNPERFIDENGQLKRTDELLPFSLGKRSCPGESLAKMEIFLFIANLFNRYKFFPTSEKPALRKAAGGGSISTQPFKCKLQRRFQFCFFFELHIQSTPKTCPLLRVQVLYGGPFVPAKFFETVEVALKGEKGSPCGFRVNSNMVVVHVERNSVADNQLRFGDVLVTFNGVNLENKRQFIDLFKKEVVNATAPRFKVDFKITRPICTLPMDPARLPPENERVAGCKYRIGVLYKITNCSLAINIKSMDNKVYVAKVNDDTLASMALKPGDAIIDVEEQLVSSVSVTGELIFKGLKKNGYVTLALEYPDDPASKANVRNVLLAVNEKEVDLPLAPDVLEVCRLEAARFRANPDLAPKRLIFREDNKSHRPDKHRLKIKEQTEDIPIVCDTNINLLVPVPVAPSNNYQSLNMFQNSKEEKK
ncbi:(pine wood nematode) hypothetical protein [Aphelenchoides besseyi]|nr:(pine wood nematode) hypothetical protein [Aphelenchoides besseyi]KAI6199254.1 (pine wood nematode) hypothetical protein [Aphelenchoides besseyi]